MRSLLPGAIVLLLLGAFALLGPDAPVRMEREIYREVLHLASENPSVSASSETFRPESIHRSPARAVLAFGRRVFSCAGNDLRAMRLAVALIVALAFSLAARGLDAPCGGYGILLGLGSALVSPSLLGWWRIAAIEPVFLALAIASLVAVARADAPRGALVAGVLLGLAIGTKVSGLVLLAGAWWHLPRLLRRRLLLGVIAGFLLQWPRVLLDPTLPIRHLDAWSGAKPPSLFFGQWTAPPWFAPPILLAFGTPPLVFAMGVTGFFRREPLYRLLAKTFLVGLAAAVLLHAELENGTRHLLPLILIMHLAGGFEFARRILVFPRATRALLVVGYLLPLLLADLRIHPASLSYWSEAIWGLRGARALGIEVTWAGEALPPQDADAWMIGPMGPTNLPYKRWPDPSGRRADTGPRLLLLSGTGEVPADARVALEREGVPLVASFSR